MECREEIYGIGKNSLCSWHRAELLSDVLWNLLSKGRSDLELLRAFDL
jgi:hypothetical protein